MKKVLCCLVFFIISASLFALNTPYLTGYTGFSGHFTGDSDDSTLLLFGQGYLGAQLHFKDTFIATGELSVKTGDILSGDILKGPENIDESVLKINELSGVFKLNTGSIAHYFSAFYGEYEPIGSDTFLQRHFGIERITSDLTSTFSGQNGSSINRFYGAGISYVLQPSESLAAGIYLYEDYEKYKYSSFNYWNYKGDEGERAFNVAVRLAGVLPFITWDWSTGVAFPQSSKTSGRIAEIKFFSINTGLNLLIGNPSATTSVFVQTGFSDLMVDPEHIVDPRHDYDINFRDMMSNLYALVEPRLKLRKADLSLTLFNIPYAKASEMFYLGNFTGNEEQNEYGGYNTCEDGYNNVNPCGIDFNVSSSYFHLLDKNFTFGMHTTLAIGGRTLRDIYKDDSGSKKWNVFASPYIKAPVRGGELFGAASVCMTQLFRGDSSSASAVNIRIGYKANF